MTSKLSGKIQTVLGPISPSQLGFTLTHEHLNIDYSRGFKDPPEKFKDNIHLPVTIENLWWIHRYPYSSLANIELKTAQKDVQNELKFFYENGGRSVVEATSFGIGRNLPKLADLSNGSGVNIIAGGGYYLGYTHPPEMDTMTQEELVQGMVHELTVGADGTSYKCGVLGEIGCSDQMLPNERKVLQAVAEAQRQMGCPVLIHTGRLPECPTESLRILLEAGGEASRTVMSHLDRCLQSRELMLEYAEMGSFLELDFFGSENSYIQHAETTAGLTDIQRIRLVKDLVKGGFGDKVVISQDMHQKAQLMNYGGHGYSHIILNVLPRMLVNGFSQAVIDKMTVDNPRTWLTFK